MPHPTDHDDLFQPILWLEGVPRKLNLIPPLRTLAFHEDFPLKDEAKCQSLQFCFRQAASKRQSMTVSIDGVTHHVGFPHLMIKRPGQAIRFLDATSAKVLYFSYAASTLPCLLKHPITPDFTVAQMNFPDCFQQTLEDIMETSKRIAEPGMADRLDLICLRLLHETLLQWDQTQDIEGPYDRNIQQLASYLQNHFMEHLNLRSLAQQVGLSYRTMLRQWMGHFHCTPTDYLNDLKMREAKRLLKETALSMHQIARRLGCCDDGYFCRFFKRHAKRSPKEFREG